MSNIRPIIIIDGAQYLSAKEAASRLNVTVQQLSSLRNYDKSLIKQGSQPTGPAWVKLQQGGQIYYELTVFTQYLKGVRFPSVIRTASAVAQA